MIRPKTGKSQISISVVLADQCLGSVELTWQCFLASLYKINSFVIANQSQVFVLDDGNFCLSSLHWSLIGQLPSREIWPTNKKRKRLVLLIISENGKQLVLFSLSSDPRLLHWLQYCQLWRPTLTTREGNFYLVSCSVSSPGSRTCELQSVAGWNCFDRCSPFENCPINFANLSLSKLLLSENIYIYIDKVKVVTPLQQSFSTDQHHETNTHPQYVSVSEHWNPPLSKECLMSGSLYILIQL